MPHGCILKNSWSEGAAKGTIQQISPSNGNQAPPVCTKSDICMVLGAYPHEEYEIQAYAQY